jgi:poly(A) polymerase/tRNA nucleotidyltransferase (CCA-adding enzyme)
MNANNLHQTYDKKKRQVLDILARMEELETLEESKNVKLPVDGKDIMAEFNLKSGPHIGKLMDKLKDAYFENPNITKEECFKLVEQEIKVLAV